MTKPRIAMCWLAGCGGCEESVLDLGEDLLTLAARAEIIFWPIALDAKYRDLERLSENGIDVTLVNGAVRDEAQTRMAGLLRRKSKLIIAHGSCAHLGGIIGLAEFFGPEALLRRAYREVPSLDSGQGPAGKAPPDEGVNCPPELLPKLKPLDRIVAVDYYLPGCPPTPESVREAIFRALDGKLPAKGTVLADTQALCRSCPRLESKPKIIRLEGFKRLHEVRWDRNRCFLDQALVCMGPATRGGCDARCLKADMPCRGCYGPPENVSDQGAKLISLFASMLAASEPEKIAAAVESLPDPAGLFYRYSLAASPITQLRRQNDIEAAEKRRRGRT